MTRRICHLVADYRLNEGIGKTIHEVARRVEGEHHVICARASDQPAVFAGMHVIGGKSGLFPLNRPQVVRGLLDALDPDAVHIHGGALASAAGLTGALRGRPSVFTMYAWPRLPAFVSMRASTWSELTCSNVLRPRVLATTAATPAAVKSLLRQGGVTQVLSPDPAVVERLGDGLARHLPSGAELSPLRARRDPAAPSIVFVGRAETARGIDTLLDAFALLGADRPGLRLRLAMIERPAMESILAGVASHPFADRIDVTTTPVDVTDVLAGGTVGAWPFKFDYTTSPPALAVAEAMSVGLPVVTTPVSCVRNLASPANAFVVPPRNPHMLAEALAVTLDDEATWTRLSDAGLTTIAERRNWDQVAEVCDDAYRTVLGTSEK